MLMSETPGALCCAAACAKAPGLKMEEMKMNFIERRNRVFDRMEEDSALILFSGIELHVSADEYMSFEANRNFFYLTGLRRDHMILVMKKTAGTQKSMLFIEEADPTQERWFGRKTTVPEAKEISGIEDVVFLDSFDNAVNRMMAREDISTLYFDCFRYQTEDLPDYNTVQAQKYGQLYQGCAVKNIAPVIAELRMQKDADEIATVRRAIAITDHALQRVMKNLKPGSKEYQAQADFEYQIFHEGADGTAFPTIAGSGANGTMLHYGTNRDTCKDGTLLLLDLGAKFEGYCADITRTYPVNGTYSERQRRVYDVVLAANRAVAAAAKPGMTLRDLNEVAKNVLAEGCIGLGLIQSKDEIGKYYMHGVSHHLGIDVHDVTAAHCDKLKPGAIITDEPGLYIDEWEIGIRIEDDLLITEDGCEVLSEALIRDPDQIEAFMKENQNK